MENQDTEISNKNNVSEIVDTFSIKVIYDVHLLMEKIKNLEGSKNWRIKKFLNFAPR